MGKAIPYKKMSFDDARRLAEAIGKNNSKRVKSIIERTQGIDHSFLSFVFPKDGMSSLRLGELNGGVLRVIMGRCPQDVYHHLAQDFISESGSNELTMCLNWECHFVSGFMEGMKNAIDAVGREHFLRFALNVSDVLTRKTRYAGVLDTNRKNDEQEKSANILRNRLAIEDPTKLTQAIENSRLTKMDIDLIVEAISLKEHAIFLESTPPSQKKTRSRI